MTVDGNKVGSISLMALPATAASATASNDNPSDRDGEESTRRSLGRMKRTAAQKPELYADNESKKKKKENLSIGFHRKELTMRIAFAPQMVSRGKKGINDGHGGIGLDQPGSLVNISRPTIQNAFRLYVNVDSTSVPALRRRASDDSGNRTRPPTCSILTVDGIRFRNQTAALACAAADGMPIFVPPFPLAGENRRGQLGAAVIGQNSSSNRQETTGPAEEIPRDDGTVMIVQRPARYIRQLIMHVPNLPKQNTPEDETESKIRRVFHDLCIELIHVPMAQDVIVHLFQRYDHNNPDGPTLINGGSQDTANDIRLKDFKFAHIQMQLFKPDESDDTLGKHVNISRVFDVTVKSPCGEDECDCKEGGFLCFKGILCQFSELQDYFTQTFVVCGAGQLKLPMLNIILSVTLYTEEEKDLKIILKELRERNLTDVGKKVLDQGLHSDFSIRCDGQSFPCHKSILAAHSDVLAAMFSASMTEVASNELVVEDMTASGVQAFLKFMYHGEIDSALNNSSIAFELLKAGHKYQIATAEKIGIELLLVVEEAKIDMSIALDMFIYCGKVDIFKPVQDKAVRVMKSRPDELIDSQEYGDLLAYNPGIAKELFKRVCLI